MSISRHESPFPEDVVHRALRCLEQHLPAFFPCRLPTAPDQFVSISRPDAFHPEAVPEAFVVEPELIVHIPLEGADGSLLEVLDHRQPDVIPASVVVTWGSAEAVPDASTAVPLFVALVESLRPTVGAMYNSDVAISGDVYDRSFEVDDRAVPVALHWMTWLSPQQLANLGDAADKLRARLRTVEVAGGLVVLVADDPVRAEALRPRLEADIGLASIQARHPKPLL